jgi:hypothetical protein
LFAGGANGIPVLHIPEGIYSRKIETKPGLASRWFENPVGAI